MKLAGYIAEYMAVSTKTGPAIQAYFDAEKYPALFKAVTEQLAATRDAMSITSSSSSLEAC